MINEQEFSPQDWQPASVAVLMVKCGYLVVQMSLRAEWKCVSTNFGEQCAITTGMFWMAMSSANSLDFNQQVLVLLGSGLVLSHEYFGPSTSYHSGSVQESAVAAINKTRMCQIWKLSHLFFVTAVTTHHVYYITLIRHLYSVCMGT